MRYPALRAIIVVFQVTAVLAAVGGAAVAVLGTDLPLTGRVGVAIVAGLLCLFQWASAEVIQVFIDIEANTRGRSGS